MGKQIILSDIPVHEEQAPERGIFFPADNPDALAEAILGTSRDFVEKSDKGKAGNSSQGVPRQADRVWRNVPAYC